MLPPLPPPPYGLFLDVDGTLLDIAPRPDAVVVPPTLLEALDALDRRLGGAVALVSGRAVADLDTLFHPLRLRASGVHGAEMRFSPNSPIESDAEASLPGTIVEALAALAANHPGTLVENKRFSAAIHYRAVPSSGPAIAESLAALLTDAEPSDLRILPGHMVFEIKRAGFDKGIAIGRFLARPPFVGRLPVFLGDDVTDEPGFAAVSAQGGQALAVGAERRGATRAFLSPAEVRTWVMRLADDGQPA